jgi:hypothetical protein
MFIMPTGAAHEHHYATSVSDLICYRARAPSFTRIVSQDLKEACVGKQTAVSCDDRDISIREVA